MTVAHHIRSHTAMMVALLLFAAGGPARAAALPGPLAGVVVDAATGAPLEGVHVLVAPEGRGTATGPGGAFRFRDLPAGHYTLHATHVAYRDTALAIHLTRGEPLRLTIALHADDLRGRAVTYAVPGTEPVHRITRARIVEMAWDELGEAVEAMPGVTLFTSGGAGGRTVVSLRGSQPRHVRVLVDGVPLNSGSGEAVDLAQIPLDEVAEVEVDPASRPGAPGGTLRITTLAARKGMRSRWHLGLEARSPRALLVDGGLGGERGGLRGRMALRAVEDTGEFPYTDERGRETVRVNNRTRRVSGYALVERTWRDDLALSLKLAGDAAELGSPGPLFQPPTPEASHEDRSLRADLRLERRTRERLTTVSLHGALRHRRYVSPERQTDPGTGVVVRNTPVDQEDEGLRAGAVLRHGWTPEVRGTSVPGLTLEAGFEGERFESVNHLGTGVTLDRTAGAVFRAHAWLEGEGRLRTVWRGWRAAAAATLRGEGVRDGTGGFDLPGGPGTDAALTGRLQFTAGPAGHGLTLHLGAGTSFAPPSFVSRFLVESVFARGNPSLKTERVEEVSGGAAFRGESGQVGATASLQAFNRITRDLVVWRADYRGRFYPDNLARARAVGAEGSLELEGGRWWALGGSMTVQRVTQQESGSRYRGNRIPFQPDLFGRAHAELGPLELLRVAVALRAAGRRYTTESNLDPYSASGGGLEPYAVLDLSLARRVQLTEGLTGRFMLAVDNILNRDYELLNRMPMPGRVWRLNMEVAS